jgi:hypothetical protein
VIDPDRALYPGSVDQLDHVRDDLPLSDKIAQSRRGGPSMMAFGVIPRLDIAVRAASMSSTRGVRCHAAIPSYRSRVRPPSRLGSASAMPSMTSCDAFRVAIFGRSVARLAATDNDIR